MKNKLKLKLKNRQLIQMTSFGWSLTNFLVRLFYQRGMKNTHVLPARVVSVGNLQVGGAGKTPLVIALARRAISHEKKVCILTRGYRSLWEKKGGIILPHTPLVDPELSGDEAALIQQHIPEAWIGVGRDRIQSFQQLEKEIEREKGRFDLVLLDDGFQHFSIKRDWDVLAITEEQPDTIVFRDFYSSIPEQSVLVLTKGEKFPEPLRDHPRLVRVGYHYEVPKEVLERQFQLICGVGRPHQVLKSLQNFGFKVSAPIFLEDHYRYQLSECQKWVQEASRQGVDILLTGKDAVKWRALGVPAHLFYVVEPKIQVQEGQEYLDFLLR